MLTGMARLAFRHGPCTNIRYGAELDIKEQGSMKLAFLTFGLIVALATPLAAQEIVRAGSTPAGQPASGLNSVTKEWEGVSVELLKAISASAGFKVEFTPLPFGELQSALVGNNIDVIAASFGISPAREKVVNFTLPYGSYRDVLVVPAKDAKAYRSLADLKGMSIATPKGSSYVEPLRAAGANVVLVDTPPEAITELEAGRVQGVVDNGLQLRHRLKKENHSDLRIIDSYDPILVGQLAFAVRKGDTKLLNELNNSLAKLREDGTVKAITTEWGLE
jgi:polar amino acid transport system substrate-binding protein